MTEQDHAEWWTNTLKQLEQAIKDTCDNDKHSVHLKIHSVYGHAELDIYPKRYSHQ